MNLVLISLERPPPRSIAPVVVRLKHLYGQWMKVHSALPKSQRYSMGIRIDSLLIEVIEMGNAAAFARREEKAPYLRAAVRKIDTTGILLSLLWEHTLVDTSTYAPLATELIEIGKMFGGWLGQVNKTPPLLKEREGK